MDRCAPELIAQAAPLRFGTVHSSSELEAVYRLRYRVALARGWAKEEDFPEGLEYDGFEGRAITVAAWNEECLAGTVRLVLPVDGELLPTEEAFGLRIEPVGLVGDVGRLIIPPECVDLRLPVLLGLLGQTWLEMRSRGLAHACGIISRSMERWYRRKGLCVRILSAPKTYWGEERVAALVPAESFDLFGQKWASRSAKSNDEDYL